MAKRSGKPGNFATVGEILAARKQSEKDKKRDTEKRRKSLNKSKNKKGKK